MIECKNINLAFSGKSLFDDLNFAIDNGDNVCISGPSGKGKSTLLKILQGYIIPDHGSIQINNQALTPTTIKSIRKSIIWVPQNINLPVNTGWELMKLMNIQPNKELVNSTIQKLDLEETIIFKDFSQISGGEKQRIIISICLSLNKNIVLMDEPTSSLDDVSIKLLIKFVRSLKGKTIVSASHNHLWVNDADKVINL
jgi:putative ABC transport system ATP-binding protein